MRLIDADNIRKKMIPHTRGEYGYSADTRKWAVLVGDIDDAPTIEAKPVKRARWVEHICFDDGFWICSNCKFVSQATAAPKLYRYCPNCGAKMTEDEA